NPVFIFEAARDDVVLERADDADQRFAPAGWEVEHLHQPLFFELPDPLVELLVTRVLRPNPSEMLRRKSRQLRKPQRWAGMKRIANRELARVDEADDVAGVSDLDRLAIAAEEPVGAGGSDRLAEAAVGQDHVLREPTRTDADERHAIAMTRVHVRLNLEHESGEPLVGRVHDARIARA